MNDNNFVQLECKQKHERDTDDDDYDDDYDDKTNKMVKWSTYEINLSSFAIEIIFVFSIIILLIHSFRGTILLWKQQLFL